MEEESGISLRGKKSIDISIGLIQISPVNVLFSLHFFVSLFFFINKEIYENLFLNIKSNNNKSNKK